MINGKEMAPAGVRPVVGRFAPTPSGRLHLGNLFCSLLAWLSAKSLGGRMVLRMEDLDPARSRGEYSEAVERDLRYLGLDWDEGGTCGGGTSGPYEQGKRSAYYQQLLERLAEKGLVYPCFCSRAELHAADAPHASDGDPIYSGRCRTLTREEMEQRARLRPPALRLRVPDEVLCFEDGHYGEMSQHLERECGDFILRRSDGVFAYQLAVVADDAAMGVLWTWCGDTWRACP
ncbi:MAG: glutamate--tRNA ligase family protein [Neglectibacter timonensis]